MNWEQAVVHLRSQPAQQELVRACYYDDPLAGAADRYFHSSEWSALRLHLPAQRGRALDLGSGRGIVAYALARDGWRVTAAEPDPSAIVGANAIRALARDSGLAIEVIEEAGEALSFADEAFDLVHCRAVLHHARDLGQLCREATRVLRRGGLFVATREHVISRQEDLAEFLDAHPLHHLYGGENAYLLGTYVGAITAAGIQLRQILNPLESDINLFPDSAAAVKERAARKLHLPSPKLVPTALLRWLGARSNVPGRHYTFIGIKKAAHG